MITRMYYVRCDGCGAACGGEGDIAFGIREARAFARRSGWTRVSKRSGSAPDGAHPGADYCPRCVTAAAERSDG